MVQSQEQWGTPFTPGTWFNFAYDIDFSGGTVGLWASTGSDPLVKVVQNIKTSPSTNSEDWHVGVLRIVNGPGAEDWYFSGVCVHLGCKITRLLIDRAGTSRTDLSQPASVTATAQARPQQAVPRPFLRPRSHRRLCRPRLYHRRQRPQALSRHSGASAEEMDILAQPPALLGFSASRCHLPTITRYDVTYTWYTAFLTFRYIVPDLSVSCVTRELGRTDVP